MIAIERDPRFLPMLAELAEASEGRLTLVEADALAVDEAAFIGSGIAARVVANLPYNISAPLLVKWLTGRFRPASMTLMFQKEVAERITAAPATPAFGRLSVLAQALSIPEIVMTLPARVFTPPPKVDSALVRFEPPAEHGRRQGLPRLRPSPTPRSASAASALESLKLLGGAKLCAAAGIDSNLRAEAIPVAGFLALARALLQERESS